MCVCVGVCVFIYIYALYIYIFRVQCDFELDTVANHLYDMYHCDVTSIPTTVLTHVFLKQFHKEQRSLSGYTDCWNRKTKSLDHPSCRKYLARACPSRYGTNPDISDHCMQAFRAAASSTRIFTGFNGQRINDYFQCIQDTTLAISPCMPILATKCHEAEMIVLKTVRISMPVIERLILKMPQLKVIHYMRDPRSLALSRLKHASFRGIYAEKSLVKTAELYCQDALNDVELRKQLQNKYPDSFYDVYFEELATFPKLTAQRIYNMIGVPLPSQVKTWLGEHTKTVGKDRTTRDSMDIVSKWKDKITEEQLQQINQICDNLFKTVNMNWKDI